MGFIIPWKLEDWQVERFLNGATVIVSESQTEAIRFMDQYMGGYNIGNLYPIRDLLEMPERPDHGVVWVQASFKMDEFDGRMVPGWVDTPYSFWELPSHIIMISNHGSIVDTRDRAGQRWLKFNEAKLALTVSDFEKPNWETGGRVHNWKNHVSWLVQDMWSTFTIAQQFALYRQADEEASDEEWD